MYDYHNFLASANIDTHMKNKQKKDEGFECIMHVTKIEKYVLSICLLYKSKEVQKIIIFLPPLTCHG